MIKESEELLLKDLCARLPYGVICKCYHMEFDEWDGKPFTAIYNETLNNIDANGSFLAGGFSYDVDEIKPYLRPMSSMTKEETKELFKEIGFEFTCNTCGIPAHYNYEFAKQIKGIPTITNVEFIKVIDWLNKKMFDYRGLIEKGLALEVPEGMYK